MTDAMLGEHVGKGVLSGESRKIKAFGRVREYL